MADKTDIADVIGLMSDSNKQQPDAVDVTILAAASAAALAADQSREASAKAKCLKADLEDAMKEKGLESIQLADRLISFKVRNNRQKTLGAMKKILGEDEGKKLWDALPTPSSESLDIPAPMLDEPGE